MIDVGVLFVICHCVCHGCDNAIQFHQHCHWHIGHDHAADMQRVCGDVWSLIMVWRDQRPTPTPHVTVSDTVDDQLHDTVTVCVVCGGHDGHGVRLDTVHVDVCDHDSMHVGGGVHDCDKRIQGHDV